MSEAIKTMSHDKQALFYEAGRFFVYAAKLLTENGSHDLHGNQYHERPVYDDRRNVYIGFKVEVPRLGGRAAEAVSSRLLEASGLTLSVGTSFTEQHANVRWGDEEWDAISSSDDRNKIVVVQSTAGRQRVPEPAEIIATTALIAKGL